MWRHVIIYLKHSTSGCNLRICIGTIIVNALFTLIQCYAKEQTPNEPYERNINGVPWKGHTTPGTVWCGYPAFCKWVVYKGNDQHEGVYYRGRKKNRSMLFNKPGPGSPGSSFKTLGVSLCRRTSRATQLDKFCPKRLEGKKPFSKIKRIQQ